MKLCVVVLTTTNEKDLKRTETCLQCFRTRSGLQPFSIRVETYIGEQASHHADKPQIIYKNHYNIAREYTSFCLENKCHLLILENDAVFHRNIGSELENQVHYLDEKYSDWNVILLGHMPAGPLLHIRPGLVNSWSPYESHAYMFNYKYLPSHVGRISKEEWKKPLMVEGWKKIPTRTVFALFPVTTVYQSEVPSFYNKLSYNTYSALRAFSNGFWISALPITTLGLSLLFPRPTSFLLLFSFFLSFVPKE